MHLAANDRQRQEQSLGALTQDDRKHPTEDIRPQALIDCMWPEADIGVRAK